MLCAERQRADDFDQIDRLASGHERDRIAIYAGNAGFAVVAVECQRKRREILVIQMDGQRNFLLPVGRFVCEAVGSQRTQRGAQIVDVKFRALICPSAFRASSSSSSGGS